MPLNTQTTAEMYRFRYKGHGMATTSPSLTQAAEFLRWINLIYSTVFTVSIRLGPDPIRVWVVERDLDCPSQNGSLTSIAAPSSLFVPGQTEAYSEYSCLSTAGQPDPESASTSLSTMHT